MTRKSNVKKILRSKNDEKKTVLINNKPLPKPKLVGNPYLKEVNRLKTTIPNWDDFFNESVTETRMEQWIRLEVLGEPLAKKYAWAIPDDRAIRILTNFSPLVEIGCGKAYWSRLLQENGVDIVPCDKVVMKNSWTKVFKDGPKCLSRSDMLSRNLFLCYPDEADSLGFQCLEHFKGQFLIHVGETIHGGTLNGSVQSPWGRTSGADFQVQLSSTFHCLLRVKLPSFPFSNDQISVWKRNVMVNGDDGNDDDNNAESPLPDDIDGDNDNNRWVHIPPDERLPDVCAPCLQHLITT